MGLRVNKIHVYDKVHLGLNNLKKQISGFNAEDG
jgi:hypothetical protein